MFPPFHAASMPQSAPQCKRDPSFHGLETAASLPGAKPQQKRELRNRSREDRGKAVLGYARIEERAAAEVLSDMEAMTG